MILICTLKYYLIFQHTVSRKDLITQAEKIIQDLGSSQSILEIQYDGEVCLVEVLISLPYFTMTSYRYEQFLVPMQRITVARGGLNSNNKKKIVIK